MSEVKKDEPLKKIKYIPVDVVEEYIKRQMWLTSDFYYLIEKYGIDVVEYRSCVSMRDDEVSMLNDYTNFTIEEFTKQRASDSLLEYLSKHIKCTGKERQPAYRATQYYYGIMIGEIPKRLQKEEEE